MKTIIAGSRTIRDHETVVKAIEESEFDITEVLCGCAQGVDTIGRRWAAENNIPVVEYRPDWRKQGKKGGILRNIAMGNAAEALIAVWDGKSKGTKHMIDYAKYKNLKIFIKIVE